MKYQQRLNRVSYAVSLCLMVSAANALAQEQETIDEVVTSGTRLQGTAAAVIEERKNQAFVADILGAEQLSRTGDSDAASALRRVTGLTLVDGKFIYVRGLGERYSSARLNGAAIPSPDLTRNVIPLDIIPASIIESLAVQKAFSPAMPAAFGGGSIDIRTKSVPSEFTAGIQFGLGYDTSAGEGNTFNKVDSGTPTALESAIPRFRGDFSINGIVDRLKLQSNDTQSAGEQARVLNRELLLSLPRDYSLTKESLDPNYSAQAFIGNSIEDEFFGGTFGFLASVSYDKESDFAERKTAVLSQDAQPDCSITLESQDDLSNSCFNTLTDSEVTTQNERLNAVLNVGYRLDAHELTINNLYLEDNEEESDIGLLQSPAGSTVFSIVGDGRANRTHELRFEERKLQVTQFLGKHTFLDFGGIGVDWQYTRSRAETDIPVDSTFRFVDAYDDSGVYSGSSVSGDNNRAIYSYTNLDDRLNSFGGNISYPVVIDGIDVELRAGFDGFDRARTYTTSSFQVSNLGSAPLQVNDGNRDPLENSGFLTDSLIQSGNLSLLFNEPEIPDADDYLAAQKVNAGYGSFDVFLNTNWRLSGGARWESFSQSSIGTSSLIFTGDDLNLIFSEERIEAGSVSEDDIFPSLAVTFLSNTNYQVRASYGETIVRPDLREVVPVTYFDPLTDIRTFGRVGLLSSPIKNYDLRYEYYGEGGDNLSVAAFYKDISSPIETVLRIGDEDYSATFVNGETAEVYGIEVEWLRDLGDMASGFFTSGNITLSDSEAVIDPAFAGNLTNPTKRITGHSQYVVNLQLSYDSANGEHSASLVYNVFGERILAAGLGGREDAFEQPFHSLDLVYKYYPDFNSTVSVKMQNILDESQEVTQSDIAVRETEQGMGFSLSYQYQF
ncbi:TonB-dependent receptor domain-containing protein [Agaribacter marinus]|uniref:TonB-dependent receptor n=1 Tax=Agaribacter marinus TaxID=1431249 RepID=A0AA37T449_9ALTE|nr:TonB-dependent receptor [Agaribacter marinus]GLR71170.1 TonB-dependent receptor [Agaribacter marinus]